MLMYRRPGGLFYTPPHFGRRLYHMPLNIYTREPKGQETLDRLWDHTLPWNHHDEAKNERQIGRLCNGDAS